MTSKEALNELKNKISLEKHINSIHNANVRKCYEIIKQDLERLEKLKKEHEKLKEKYKHRAETSNDLCEAVKCYEKAFEILKSHMVIKSNSNIFGINMPYQFIFDVSQQEYEILKEVLKND